MDCMDPMDPMAPLSMEFSRQPSEKAMAPHSSTLAWKIPWTEETAHQAPLFMGFIRQEYWNGLPFPFPRDTPDPGIEHGSLALTVDSLPLSHSSILNYDTGIPGKEATMTF
ncbi:hypothetical protein MG293_001578 [Ovis ammon polii]|uniref:Uncharacterized protein n=1 Tax=Ovis ammon polii TaxID=230172 RepID=A0AAD4UMR5_OVIAM|nr:hypothetical protein MG293_001578 [Ovis ammon polii]